MVQSGPVLQINTIGVILVEVQCNIVPMFMLCLCQIKLFNYTKLTNSKKTSSNIKYDSGHRIISY